MRFRTLVIWVVVLGFLGWAAYTIVAAGSSYLEAAGVVDQAVIGRRLAAGRLSCLGPEPRGGPGFRRRCAGPDIRNGRTRRSRPQARERRRDRGRRGVRVAVEWSIPVTFYERMLFHLPLSVTRLYPLPDPRPADAS